MRRSVRVEHSLATRMRNALNYSVWKSHCFDHVHCIVRDENLDVWLKERIQSGPLVRDDRDAARRRFEDRR